MYTDTFLDHLFNNMFIFMYRSVGGYHFMYAYTFLNHLFNNTFIFMYTSAREYHFMYADIFLNHLFNKMFHSLLNLTISSVSVHQVPSLHTESFVESGLYLCTRVFEYINSCIQIHFFTICSIICFYLWTGVVEDSFYVRRYISGPWVKQYVYLLHECWRFHLRRYIPGPFVQ